VTQSFDVTVTCDDDDDDDSQLQSVIRRSCQWTESHASARAWSPAAAAAARL